METSELLRENAAARVRFQYPIQSYKHLGDAPFPNADALIQSFRAAQSSRPPIQTLGQILRPNEMAQLGTTVAGTQILLRDDPIFRIGLTVHRDEREWRVMRQSESAISTPMRSLIRSMLGYGWNIETASKRGNSKAAQLLREFIEAAVQTIDFFDVYLEQVSRGYFYGWQPAQAIWFERDGKTPRTFSFNGRSYNGIRVLAEQPAEFFAFTPDERFVFLGDGVQPPAVYDAPGDSFAWITQRFGSTRSPYGEAMLSSLWVDWYVLKRFKQFYETGARNALEGQPVFSEKSGGQFGVEGLKPNATERRNLTAQYAEDIRQALAFRKEYGALLIPSGFDFEDMIKVESAAGWLRSIDRLRLHLQVAIEGSELTSTVGDSGSRALGDVHKDTKLENCKALARMLAPQVSNIFHKIIEVNQPIKVDPEDMPRLVMRVERRIDPNAAKFYMDYGGELDGLPIAKELGLPVPEGTEEVILKKQEASSSFDLTADGAGLIPPNPVAPRKSPTQADNPDATAESTRKPAAARSELPPELKPAAQHADAMARELEVSEGERVAGAFQTYMRLLGEAVREAASLPGPFDSRPE